MTTRISFVPDLIKRYDLAGPRYTSYPTAAQFHEGFDAECYRRYVAASNDELIPAPLSLYVHLPFCRSLCYYCGCTKKVTRHDEHGVAYLEQLAKEIRLQGELFDRDRPVRQLHFGGGTPTFFDDTQLQQLVSCLRAAFTFEYSDRREFTIEVDPRTVDRERLALLADIGFNRVSLGVQDLDPEVQEAVNRVQDPAATLGMVAGAREVGFNSVSIDLIYGLPLQTPERFARTIDAVVAARPDRLAIYNYAHMPHIFRAQRMIRQQDLPSPETRLELLKLSIDRLTAAGYVFIGMDHFALPDDELTRALEAGTLHRSFQGYSTHDECDLIGLGVSAIGRIGDCYAQNFKEIASWKASVESGALPIWRGIGLTGEDRLRRAVIEAIMCGGKVEFEQFEREFNIDFNDYFAVELERLEALEADGLVGLDEDRLEVTPPGRLLLRAIAMTFDDYLEPVQTTPRYSRVI